MIQINFTDTEILATEDCKLVGKIEFALAGNELSILHTYAYESGRGIGSLLMKNAMEWAKTQQYVILPICPFAQKYIEKNNN